jgi:aspartyl/asparaginyl beta-hydroxylase (cupin superfamily)
MDQGAALIKKDFGYSDALRSVLEELDAEDWVPTHADGPYESDGWRVVPFVEFGQETPMMERFPIMAKVLQEFKCPVKMMVYYNMLPGAKIHPHRDTSGTMELGFLRFHVPIRTNPQVDFHVDNVAVPMREGQLWALNTSHKHAVSNLGNSDRVHLVLEVEVNQWVRSVLPRRTYRYYLHVIGFGGVVLAKTVGALFKPARFASYVRTAKVRLADRRNRGQEKVQGGS